LHRGLDSGSLFPLLSSSPGLGPDARSPGNGKSREASGGVIGRSAAGEVACVSCGNTECIMSKQYASESGMQPEIRKTSDRLMVILGQALVEELEKAQQEGESVLAWQFGSLDALTKHLSGSLAAIVTLLKGLNPPQKDFVLFRQRVHRQPPVLFDSMPRRAVPLTRASSPATARRVGLRRGCQDKKQHAACRRLHKVAGSLLQ